MKPKHKAIILLSCLMFCLLAPGVSANVLSITPASATHQIGETQSYNIVLDSAPQALSGFNITIAIANSAVAEITGVSFPVWANPTSNGTTPSSSVWCKAIDLNNQSGMQNIILCTVTVHAIGTGTTNINIISANVEDTVGGRYSLSVVPSILTVGGVAQIASVGVFRSGTFYRYGATPVAYGLATDKPITGNWNGGSTTGVGVFRSGTFYLNGYDGLPIAYGLSTDLPVTGDWNGDTHTEVGVFRSGTFYRYGATPVAYGVSTDTPITGDWNGDGTTEVGVFRSGTFYRNGGTPVAYGLGSDTPITGDWNGDGTTEVGVFRSGTFYLNGATSVAYGLGSDTPVTGSWV